MEKNTHCEVKDKFIHSSYLDGDRGQVGWTSWSIGHFKMPGGVHTQIPGPWGSVVDVVQLYAVIF